jgi:hypothetical protein
MSAITKLRRRAGTYATFERRFLPIDGPDGSIVRNWDDPDILKAFDEGRFQYVWTIVEGDSGDRMYLVPGFSTVNYFARVLCAKPWAVGDEYQPGYVW